MKPYIMVLASVVILAVPAATQSACRQSTASVVEHHEAFTVYSLSLPSRSGTLLARALIPHANRSAGAVVFSFSTLVASEPERLIEMMPVATELAKRGRATIVIQRTLTWPAIDQSVGKMQSAVLCAEQWLSTHANAKSDDWAFVGPESDVPTFDQLHALGDTTSMTFNWGLSLGEPNAPNDDTENVLRDGSQRLLLGLTSGPWSESMNLPLQMLKDSDQRPTS
jgi:hypothetical protein